jgi:hypothetical protein
MKATLTFALLLAAYIAAGVASLDPFMLAPAGAAGALISCAIWRSANIKTYFFISLWQRCFSTHGNTIQQRARFLSVEHRRLALSNGMLWPEHGRAGFTSM